MNKKKLYIISATLLIISLLGVVFSGILIEHNHNLWWTMLLSFIVFVVVFVVTCCFYFPNAEFICNKCNKQFKPKATTSLMAVHTLTRRYLRCPYCNERSWCKETWNLRNNSNQT